MVLVANTEIVRMGGVWEGNLLHCGLSSRGAGLSGYSATEAD